MNLRFITLLLATLSVVQVARADEPAATSDPVQVAQAMPVAAPRTDAVAQAPQQIHGTLRGVLAAADRGPDALRQYIQRTRMIYGYRFEDFAHADWYR